MASLTIAGTAFNCIPFPAPSIEPALTWTREATGYWSALDRGASQDIYRSKLVFEDTDTNINTLKTLLNVNKVAAVTLSSMNTDIFSPEVNHSGTITAVVENFGFRKHLQFASTSSSVTRVEVTLRATSKTLLGTTPSLSTLKLQPAWEGDVTYNISKYFSYDQSGSAYINHNNETGRFVGRFLQSRTQARAILAYLLTTARGNTITLPTFPGATYPFGVAKGSGPFNVKVKSFDLERVDLNRWLITIEFVESL